MSKTTASSIALAPRTVRERSHDLLARVLDEPQLVQAVRELPPRALGAIVRHIGLEDAGELVSLATADGVVTAQRASAPAFEVVSIKPPRRTKASSLRDPTICEWQVHAKRHGSAAGAAAGGAGRRAGTWIA